MVTFFKDVLVSRNYKEASTKAIIQHVRHFLKWVENGDIEEISFGDVEKYIVFLSKSGRCEKTIQNRLSSIKGYFDFLTLHGHIDRNPVQIVRRLKLPDTMPVYLPNNEIEILLDLAKMIDIYNEIMIALNTGLRMNELRHLRWKDVDFKNRQLIVHGEYAKGKRPRTVPINQKALSAFEDQYRLYKSYQWVFPGGQGGKGNKNKWTRNTMRSYNWWLRYSLDPIREQIPTIASLPKGNTCRGWHILRHTFATKLARAGVDLIKIKEWMGHRSINTTMRYIHLQNQYDEAIELI